MTELFWEALKVGLSALAMGVSGWAWVYSRRAQKIAKMGETVDELSRRVSMVETTLELLPSTHNWNELHNDITALRGDLKTSAAQIHGLGAGLKRVENQISLLMENELRGQNR